MNKRVGAIGVVVLTLLGACARDDRGAVRERQAAHRTPIVVSAYEEQAFLEMAVHDGGGDLEATRAVQTLQRWDHDVTFAVAGSPTADDVTRVHENAATLSELMAPLRVTVVNRVHDADVAVHFVAREQFARILDTTDFPADADGIAQPRVRDGGHEDGRIQSVTIVVDVGLAQHARNHVVSHELLHAVGLDHSSCLSSLMYAEGSNGASPLWSLSPLDRRMLSLLYRPELAPGMDMNEVDNALAGSAAAGVTCDPPQWQLVIDASDNRPYFCHTGTDRYRPCTSDLRVEPTSPLADPDLWFDGTYAYDEFPLRG
ncbi:MAG: DUF2927 domain-containing protein [Actinobacteria bacterium]|nr:DUF2927 domain-containing protein [Actinomycetota bacterium]